MTEPTHSTVRYALDGGVATITLERPEALNALDGGTKEALLDAVLTAGNDRNARCVVLTGSGRAFCAGQDLREHAVALAAGSGSLRRTVTEHYNPIAYELHTMPKPVVAAVNGVAAGAGAAFAFACDFRIVAETASFALAFGAIGLSCDSGTSWSLPRLVGVAKAKELLLLGGSVDAAEALRIGLASEVVPADRVAERARELARMLADGPTAAYGAMRRALAYSATHDLADALTNEALHMQATAATTDHRNAVEAFLAKRRPEFTGT